jgi:hypothetical protein
MEGFKSVIGDGATHFADPLSENMFTVAGFEHAQPPQRSSRGCHTEGCIPEKTDTGCFSMTEKERVKNGAPNAGASAMWKRGPVIGAGTEKAAA